MFDADKQKVCAVQHVALSDDSRGGEKHESEKVCAVQHVALSDNSRGEKTESEKVCAVQHVALSDNLSQAVAGIADGLIPSDLDQLAALGINILAINAKTRQTISVIIAAASSTPVPERTGSPGAMITSTRIPRREAISPPSENSCSTSWTKTRSSIGNYSRSILKNCTSLPQSRKPSSKHSWCR